jgi:hypothetical protein
VTDARNGESYSGSLTESKDRERKRKKIKKKNRYPKVPTSKIVSKPQMGF